MTAPIHCSASFAETHFYKPDDETNSDEQSMSILSVLAELLIVPDIAPINTKHNLVMLNKKFITHR